jgi:hypothetical protein
VMTTSTLTFSTLVWSQGHFCVDSFCLEKGGTNCVYGAVSGRFQKSDLDSDIKGSDRQRLFLPYFPTWNSLMRDEGYHSRWPWLIKKIQK